MFGIRPWYMDSMDVKVLDLLRATQIMRLAAPQEHPIAPALRPSKGNTTKGIFRMMR